MHGWRLAVWSVATTTRHSMYQLVRTSGARAAGWQMAQDMERLRVERDVAHNAQICLSVVPASEIFILQSLFPIS